MKITFLSTSPLSSFLTTVKSCPGKVYNLAISLFKALWHVVTFLPKKCLSIITYPFRKKDNTQEKPPLPIAEKLRPPKAPSPISSLNELSITTDRGSKEKKKVRFSIGHNLPKEDKNLVQAHLDPIPEENISPQTQNTPALPKILHLPFDRKAHQTHMSRQQMADLASTAPSAESPPAPDVEHPPEKMSLQPPIAPKEQEAIMEEDFYLFPPRARPKVEPMRPANPAAQRVPKTDFLDETEAFFKDVTGAVSGFFDTLLTGFQPDRPTQASSTPTQQTKRDPKKETFFSL